MKYKELCEASTRIGEENDCAVFAVAAACNVPYWKAHVALSESGRINKDGASFIMMMKAARKLGYNMQYCPQLIYDVQNELYTEHGVNNNWFSPHLLANRKLETLEGNYIFTVRNHTMACIDSEIQDYTKTKRRKVNMIFRVTKNG